MHSIVADLTAKPAPPDLAYLSTRPVCIWQGQRRIRETGDRISLKRVVMELTCHVSPPPPHPPPPPPPPSREGEEMLPHSCQGRSLKGATCREDGRGKLHLTSSPPTLAAIPSSLGHERRVARVTGGTWWVVTGVCGVQRLVSDSWLYRSKGCRRDLWWQRGQKAFCCQWLYLWSLMGQRFKFFLSLSGQLRW